MKKVFVILLSAAFLLTVLTGCSKKDKTSEAPGLPKKVTIGAQMAVDPEGIAIAEGWLNKIMGVEVDIVYFDSGRDVNIAMASGSIDFGLLGSPPASLGIANGIQCRLVWIHAVVGESDSLIVRGNLGVRDAQGLIGLKIATTFSSATHYGLFNYLKINNVNPRDIDIIDMRPAEIAAAFIRGDIDGAFTWDPHVSRMKDNGGVVLTDAKELANRGYPVMDVEIVRTEFAERYPELVSAYIRTLDRAVALYRNDPQAAGAALARYIGIPAEECLAQAAGATWLSVNDQKSLRWSGSSSLANTIQDTAMFFYELGDLSQEPSIELFQQAVTNRYLEEYKGE